MGTRLPVVLLQYGVTAEQVVHAVTVAVVESA
jgi:phosphotransacetylase